MRDIAHAFPSYLFRAAQILEEGPKFRFFDVFERMGGTPEKVGEVVRFWQRYFENCQNPEYATQQLAFNASGFEDLDMHATGTAATALMLVLFSAYYSGLKEATFTTRPDENPVNQVQIPMGLYLRPTNNPLRLKLRRLAYRIMGVICRVL